MEVDIIISNRLFELRISPVPERLPTITHMIEITVFYSFFIRVKKPSIHDRDTKVIWIPISMIKRCPIFARHSLIDKNSSSERTIPLISDKNTVVTRIFKKHFSSHAKYEKFIWICDFGLPIVREKFLYITSFLDTDLSRSESIEDVSPMSTRLRCPLVPVVCSIEMGKCTPRRVQDTSRDPERKPIPTFWFRLSPERSPGDDTMRYIIFPESFLGYLFIVFLDMDRPESWEKTRSRSKTIFLPDFYNLLTDIPHGVFIEYPRSSSIICEICWDVFSF